MAKKGKNMSPASMGRKTLPLMFIQVRACVQLHNNNSETAKRNLHERKKSVNGRKRSGVCMSPAFLFLQLNRHHSCIDSI
mmetsp:Transcript_55316/g.108266  ORF Transcript_55316/g.108266 Transcript_55316/m.108266 type:complete len:80 (-) Transcript_55316:1327-1566(-)